MQQYDSYKDSGVKWLGEIPSHWEVLALKHILTSKKVLVGKHSSQYELLSLTLKGVVKRDMDNPEGKFPASFDTYQAVEPNDFIFCNFDNEETPRAVGLSPYKGMITGAYDVLSRNNPKLTDGFLIYYFLYIDDAKRFKPLYKGLRKTVPFDSFMSYKIPVPSIKEQNAIVSYLDTATAKIDAAIAQQQKMIDLLNERKQIIIDRAVTKGLNPYAKMKDSGVEWIGEVPEEWKILSIKRFVNVYTGKTPSTTKEYYFENGDLNWYTPGDLNQFKLNDSERKVTVRAKREEACPMFPPNTVYLVGIGGTIGKVSYSEQEASCNQQINALVPRKDFVYYKYLAYSLQILKVQIYQNANLSTLPIINQERTGALLMLRPPLAEQMMIVDYIEKATQPIEAAIETANKMISLLQERKQIIINEVVTGKVKVV